MDKCCLDKGCRPEECPDLPQNIEGWPIPCLTGPHARVIVDKCCSDLDPDLPDLPADLPQFDAVNASDEALEQRKADLDWLICNTSVDNRLEPHRWRMIA